MHHFIQQHMRLLQNLIVCFFFIVLYISWLAYADSNRQLKKAIELYNQQPRFSRLYVKKKWPARIIDLITFYMFR